MLLMPRLIFNVTESSGMGEGHILDLVKNKNFTWGLHPVAIAAFLVFCIYLLVCVCGCVWYLTKVPPQQ